ncbi:hypothetical protein AciX8_2183 [Granulicella mallensis MP5ACTX8]|uniref:Uncharacterized protein n=1 Tax=Granulicella mallensis (strain ATCC BAA-1857 / DSM 23137 / MP5ACTX8) TaxID=682795 RepID=G8NVC5_GRAMM|nr:hypothetical protein AciX8_2183 [Granulicella mallensis MP5ACTX8]
MCCTCKSVILLDDWPGGERTHTFWGVEFPDIKSWLTDGRKRRFDHADTIRDLISRTPTHRDLAARETLDSAFRLAKTVSSLTDR